MLCPLASCKFCNHVVIKSKIVCFEWEHLTVGPKKKRSTARTVCPASSSIGTSEVPM